jgi:hypothetical protein
LQSQFVPKVVIVQPQYGLACEQSMLARFSAIDRNAGEPDRVQGVKQHVVGTSLLPHTFNVLLCIALDARDAGEVTHLAMLHSDIWPAGPWVTQLWHEMRTHGADLVSAMVPIKEPGGMGRMSTAIGSESDQWGVLRNIHQRDQAIYPATFGPEHVCENEDEVLLVNTGCWLADLRHPAWDSFESEGGFNFRTRITRHPETGKRLAWCQPEDYLMSRHIQQHGARVMATWNVQLRHGGWAWWDNFSVSPESLEG